MKTEIKTTATNIPDEVPAGCKCIWSAFILIEVRRYDRKKIYKENRYFNRMVYKDGEEKIKGSYFLNMLEKELNLKQKKYKTDKKEYNDEYTILQIDKTKFLNFSIPETNE